MSEPQTEAGKAHRHRWTPLAGWNGAGPYESPVCRICGAPQKGADPDFLTTLLAEARDAALAEAEAAVEGLYSVHGGGLVGGSDMVDRAQVIAALRRSGGAG